MESINKKGGFKPFFILFGILGILLIGIMITPLRLVLDDSFERIEESALANGTPELSCTNPNASGLMKGTCFTLGGFMVVFILYILYSWVNGMVAGAKSPRPIFSPRYKQQQAQLAALES